MKHIIFIFIILTSLSSWSRDGISAAIVSTCVQTVDPVFGYVTATNTPALSKAAIVRVRKHNYGASIEVVEMIGKDTQQIRIQDLDLDGGLRQMVILDVKGRAQFVKPRSRINKSLILDRPWTKTLVERFVKELNSSVADTSEEAAYNVWWQLKRQYAELFTRN